MINISYSLDLKLAASVVAAVLVLVLFKGDALYLTIGYYVLVPLAFLWPCAAVRVKPPFLLGVSLALSISLIAYSAINWRAARPEGLLVLGHLFSLPGSAFGVAVAIIFLLRSTSSSLLVAFAFGFTGTAVGFLVNQLLVCNSLMWCGRWSFLLD